MQVQAQEEGEKDKEQMEKAQKSVPNETLATKRRITVPLLPPMVREPDAAATELAARVKRVRDIINSTVSSKPAKLARYNDTEPDMINKSTDLQLLCRHLNGDGSDLDNMNVYMSFCSLDVIPLQLLKMEQRHTPLDVKAFLSRVSTFDLRLWSVKPDRLCSFHCARYGWRIAGKNTLLCVSCRQLLTIPQDEGRYNLEEWIATMVQFIQRTGHMSDCIWVKSPSPADILVLPEGNDMQIYMKMAAQSFNLMKTMPEFTVAYRNIMQMLNMDGLKEKTGLKLTQEIEGVSTRALEETALFLMLNGWIMAESDINVLKCQKCLRQIPVWLCLPTPSMRTLDEFLSPPTSPATKALKNLKALDPVSNHWFWCPWRKILQRNDPNKKLLRFLEIEETNLFAHDFDMEFAHEFVFPEINSYITLAVKLDADFKRGRLLNGPNLEMSDNDTAIRTITNFRDLLNSATSRSGDKVTPVKRSWTKPVLPISQTANEIVFIKDSTNIYFGKPNSINKDDLEEPQLSEETLLRDDLNEDLMSTNEKSQDPSNQGLQEEVINASKSPSMCSENVTNIQMEQESSSSVAIESFAVKSGETITTAPEEDTIKAHSTFETEMEIGEDMDKESSCIVEHQKTCLSIPGEVEESNLIINEDQTIPNPDEYEKVALMIEGDNAADHCSISLNSQLQGEKDDEIFRSNTNTILTQDTIQWNSEQVDVNPISDKIDEKEISILQQLDEPIMQPMPEQTNDEHTIRLIPEQDNETANYSIFEPIGENAVRISDPVNENTIHPIAEPMSESTTLPIAEPVGDDTIHPIAEPAGEDTIHPFAEPAGEDTIHSIADAVGEDTILLIADPGEDTIHPIVELMSEDTILPIVEPMNEDAIHPIVDPVIEDTIHGIVEPISEDKIHPIVDPVSSMSEPSENPIQSISGLRQDIVNVIPSVLVKHQDRDDNCSSIQEEEEPENDSDDHSSPDDEQDFAEPEPRRLGKFSHSSEEDDDQEDEVSYDEEDDSANEMITGEEQDRSSDDENEPGPPPSESDSDDSDIVCLN